MGTGTPIGSMQVELGLDATKFNPELASAKRAVQYFKTQIKGLDGALKTNGSNLAALKTKHSALKQAIESQKNVVASLKGEFDRLDPGSSKWEAAAVKYEKGRIELEKMERELGKVSDQIGKVEQSLTLSHKVSTTLHGWGDKAKAAGNRLREMGDLMKPVSALLTAGFTLATKKAIDFESQMQVTKSLLADTVQNSTELNAVTEKLSKSSKGWAKEYGISTSAINEGMQEIIKKGFDANQTIEAMPNILNAAKASGEDFNTVMNASTNILQQFGLNTSDTGRVTDALAFVANKTAAGFADMGNAMEYVGPVAKNVGMSLEETAAVVGLLSNNGIAGEKAGTALRGALTRLLKPSKQNATAMADLGFNTEEFKSGAIKLPDIIDRIKKSTEGMTDAQKSALLAQAFGTEAQTAMNILVDQGSDALRNLAKETENAQGYTKRLSDEMLKSSKSGVDKFKSSIEVLQINVGQKLLPALTPIIEWVSRMIEKFDQLPPATQNMIVWFGLATAAAYPLLNIFGNIASVGGTLLHGLGNLAKRAGPAIDGISGLAGVATKAEGSVGLLGGAVGLLGSPVTWGILLGGAALGAIAYIAAEAGNGEKRTREWGAAVDEVQAGELQRFKDKVDESTHAMEGFGTGGVENLEKVKKAFGELLNDITEGADKENKALEEMARKFGLSDEQIAKGKAQNDRMVQNARNMVDEIVNIYQKHNNDRSRLTDEEKSIVLNNQTELINAQLELMKYSGKEKENIQKAMNGQIHELNRDQQIKTLDEIGKWLKAENDAYKQGKDELKQLYDEGYLNREEYQQKLATLEADHLIKTEAYKTKYAELSKAIFDSLTFGSGGQEELVWSKMVKNMEKLGINYDETVAKMEAGAKKASAANDLIALSTVSMSDETKAANLAWNSLVFDDKAGEVKTNAREEVQTALLAENGWANMQFVLKEANLNTNARLTIAEALIANGQWQALTPEEKRLVVDNNIALKQIFDSKDLLSQWNGLSPEQKILVAEDLTAHPIKSAQDALNSVKQDHPAPVAAENQTFSQADEASRTINAVKQNRAPLINAQNETGAPSRAASNDINSVRQHNPAYIRAINEASQAAQAARWDLLNIPTSITSTITTFVQKIFSNEHGTDFHPGGLAMVNDQKGSLYKELVTLPTGEQFIPEGRDVILPLPRGSKVLPARQTRDLMRSLHIPNYAKGVGYSENSPLIRGIDRAQSRLDSRINIQQPSNARLEKMLERLLLAMESQGDENATYHFNLELGGIAFRSLIDKITLEQQRNEKIRLRMT